MNCLSFPRKATTFEEIKIAKRTAIGKCQSKDFMVRQRNIFAAVPRRDKRIQRV